jgi:hypothetical protein
MLLDQKVIVKWNPKNREHYENKGYPYTGYNQAFEVDVKELMQGAKAYVDVKCDYCGDGYQVMYNTYTSYRRDLVNKDACNKCKIIKQSEVMEIKYGVTTSLYLPEVRRKQQETNLKKYGGISPTQSKEVREKISKAQRHFDLIPIENILKDKNGNYDLTGLKFGKLVVIKRKLGYKDKPLKRWICECTCENKTIVDVEERRLIDGTVISCGCISPESSTRMKKNMTTNGYSKERLYRIWRGMKKRCHDENDHAYYNYGARGISVCEEWISDYPKFREWALNNGYADDLTIDRIDNDEGYNPDNCRWFTKGQQADNRRVVRQIEINGEKKTITEWAKFSGIPRKLIESRIAEGWSGADLLKPKEVSKSGHKYILWLEHKKRWKVSIYINEKERITIGSYKNLDEAINARNEALQRPDVIQRLQSGNQKYKNN